MTYDKVSSVRTLTAGRSVWLLSQGIGPYQVLLSLPPYAMAAPFFQNCRDTTRREQVGARPLAAPRRDESAADMAAVRPDACHGCRPPSKA